MGSLEDRSQAELRRGVLQIAVLALLRTSSYGYDLLRTLGEIGLTTEEGTLYPVLRRLEKDGLLVSEWNTEGSRPRKYYRTTDRGRTALEASIADWDAVNRALGEALGRSGESHGAHQHGQQGPA